MSATRNIHAPEIYQEFQIIVRKRWMSITLVTIAFDLLPNALIDWFITDPNFGSTAWSYSLSYAAGLIFNSLFSVLLVYFCLSAVGGPGRQISFPTILSSFGRFFLFGLVVDLPGVVELVLSIISHNYGHSFSAPIGLAAFLLRVGAISAFGLFLPTLLEGETFKSGLRKSFLRLAGSRTILLVAYALFCVADFLPTPIFWLTNLAGPLIATHPREGLALELAGPKVVGVIFEAAWLIFLSSFFLDLRARSDVREFEDAVGEFD